MTAPVAQSYPRTSLLGAWLLSMCLSASLWAAAADLQQARMLLVTQPGLVIELLEPKRAASAARADEDYLELLSLLVRAYVAQSRLSLANETALALAQAARQQQQPRYQGIALREQGRIAAIQTRYQDALALYQQARPHFDPEGDRLDRGLTLNAEAHALRALFQYGPALSSARKALALFREVGATAEMADAFNAMGVILERMGDLEESLAAHAQALDIRRSLANKPGIADSLYNIGEIYRELQDFAAAEAYLSESIDLDRALDNRSSQAYGLYKLADIQCALDKFDLARQNGTLALAMFQELGASENIAHVLTNMAKLEYRADNLDAALSYIQQAQSEMPLQAAPELQGKLDLYQARILLRRGALAEAQAVIEQNLSQVELLDNETMLAFYRALSDVYEAQGQVGKALATLRDHNRLRTQRLNKIRSESLAKVRASVEFLQREQQLQLLSKDKNIQAEIAAHQTFERNAMILGAIVLLGFALVLFGRYRLRRRLTQLEAQVQSHAQDNAALVEALADSRAHLAQAAHTDPLTGLANRQFLLTHVEQDCAKSMREYLNWLQQRAPLPVQSDLVFYLVDLDHLKSINDRHGHAAGDEVLKQMQQRLLQIFREEDYIVRWGGEEFLAVARFGQRENAALQAERLRALVQRTPFKLASGDTVLLTVSVGFACFPFYTDRPGHYRWDQVVDIADLCLYAAKLSGRNSWVGMTGVEGLEHVDTFQRLFTEPAQVIREGWVNLYTSLEGPEALVWQNEDNGFKPN